MELKHTTTAISMSGIVANNEMRLVWLLQEIAYREVHKVIRVQLTTQEGGLISYLY